MKVTEALKEELADWLDTYWTTYLNGDIATWATFIRDDYRNIGGTKEEIWNSKQEIIDYTNSIMDQMLGTVDIRNREVELIPYGDYIMVNEFTDLFVKVEGEWIFYGPFRMSSLLEKTGSGWMALHQHGSYPDMKAMEGEAFSLDALKAENAKLQAAVKSRTQELEQNNRELEIEAATERVRVQSMAMQHPADIAQVNQELLNQLTKLDIPGLSGVSFYFVDQDEIVTVWDLSSPGNMNDPNSYSFKYDANKAPVLGEFVGILKSSQEDYFVLDFPKERLLMAIEELKLIDGNISNLFKEAVESGALHHQWNPVARITDGILSIDLMMPPTEDTKTIVLKMAGAFNQAYTRFLDLQKAETQARESQIQLALERVRARSMAMHKSEELAEASVLLFEQLKLLGVHTYSSGFSIWEKENLISWMCNADGSINPPFSMPVQGHAWHILQYESWKKGEPFTWQDFQGEEMQSYFRYLRSFPLLDAAFKKSIAAGHPMPERQIHHIANFSQGNLIFITLQPCPEAHEIFIRFAKVFEQTYTRFLDLQKAEAQVREAQIETALEKVRSRSLAMHKSDELNEVVSVLFERLKDLHIPFTAVGIAISIDGSKDLNAFVCGEDEAGLVITNYQLPYFDNKISNDFNNVLENQLEYYVGHYSKKEKDAFYSYVLENTPEFRQLPENIKRMIFDSKAYTVTMMAVNKATFNINDFEGKVLASEEVDIIKRFAKVFDQAYTRFLDLQKAEALATEAQIHLIQIEAEKTKAQTALTELKNTQGQLIQAEKMASLGELTAGIAHEIQNPLNFVNNFSELSNELIAEMVEEVDKGNTEEVKAIARDIQQNLEKINHHGKRADAIVKGMLQHSNNGTGKKEPTDINALADEYLRLAFHGLRAKDKSFNATLVTDYDESIGNINIIPQDIGRVILNLITNAFYAVAEQKKAPQPPEGGAEYTPTVTVSTKLLKPPSGGLGALISVRDNGSGIPQNIIDKIFQPFFTTKPTGQGTGLGLSLSYDIVKAHGGELKVQTKEGEGTDFIIVLPL